MVKVLIGYQYLDKFFDFQFNLNEININNYIRSFNIIEVNSGRYFDTCSKEICLRFDFSLRQINRYFNLMKLIYNYINNHAESYEDMLSNNILFPIMLGIKIYNINIYNRIINGTGENELKNIILNNLRIVKVFNDFFSDSFTEFKQEFLFNFSELYKNIFIKNQNDERKTSKIGARYINYEKTRKKLMSLLSFLNEFIQL